MPSTFKAIVFRVLVLHVILRNALGRGKCDFVCQKKIHLKNCSCICFLTLKYVSSIEMSWMWNDSFIEKFSLTFGLSSTLEREKKKWWLWNDWKRFQILGWEAFEDGEN